jgi:hypothetical protein
MKLAMVALLGVGAVIGWPIVKDAAIDRIQSNAGTILRAQGGPLGDAWKQLAEINDMAAKIPGMKEAAHQKTADEVDAMPFDRQVEFVINALLIDVRG